MTLTTTTRSALLRATALSWMTLAACTGTTVDKPGGDESGGSAAAAGAAGAAGAVGTGGSEGGGGPSAEVRPANTDKVDLLFVVDNSASMADKQQVLQIAVRDLISRLTNPLCVDSEGVPLARTLQPLSAAESCPGGAVREFPPTNDVHVGVISSSLGGHGADSCSSAGMASYTPRMEDMAHLLSQGPQGEVPTYEGLGYLNWDPQHHDSPPGEDDAAAFAQHFGDIVLGVGQDGCGFESTLESWYRFLVDPVPYASLVPAPCSAEDTSNACRAASGVDQQVLAQRAAFLRPDSVVAIVMLTDENDCSVVDGGQNYLALQALNGAGEFHLTRGTAACETDPSSPDCKSCWQVQESEHPECAIGGSDPSQYDALNVRCYRQKQRFGIDFLQPLERYVQGLTSPTLDDGRMNPLFCSTPTQDGMECTTPLRNPSQVVLTGILGVPWQDIARDPSDLSSGYATASELNWDRIAGDPSNGMEPTDPLMVEAIAPRAGTNPATGTDLTAPGSLPSNPINGGEWDIAMRDDLQYACIFALPEPIDGSMGGDCVGAPHTPLCRDPQTNNYGQTQYAAKAYPATRQLVVLQSLGDNAVVSSICPANLSDASRADFGYRPAMAALGDRLRENLK